MCKQLLAPKSWVGGKVNQLGYVAPPTSKWMNFKKWFIVNWQAVSVFCETYPLIVVTAISSNSESIAAQPVIEGILID